jgi:hypothetical protein
VVFVNLNGLLSYLQTSEGIVMRGIDYVLMTLELLTEMPTGGIVIVGALLATLILILWLVYKQMSASPKEVS